MLNGTSHTLSTKIAIYVRKNRRLNEIKLIIMEKPHLFVSDQDSLEWFLCVLSFQLFYRWINHGVVVWVSAIQRFCWIYCSISYVVVSSTSTTDSFFEHLLETIEETTEGERERFSSLSIHTTRPNTCVKVYVRTNRLCINESLKIIWFFKVTTLILRF